MALPKLIVNIGANLKDFEKQLGKLDKSLLQAGLKFKRMGADISLATAPLIAFGATAVKASITFESAFTGVRKTVDATEETIKGLEKGILDLSKKIPATVEQIAAVAEVGGQLGIDPSNLLKFTETMIQLGDAAPTVQVEEAATALAQFANITKMNQGDFDRLASSIVELGNNLATNEGAIIEMAQRIAGAGSVVNMTQSEIIGLSGALAQLGINAEAGGTAISQVLLKMQKEVETGGENLKIFSALVPDFANKFKEDASSALVEFIGALGSVRESGGSVIQILEALGMSNVRISDTLLRTSGNAKQFAEAIGLSNEAWKENGALSVEAEKRYATLESRLKILWNEVRIVAIELGDALRPAIEQTITAVREATTWFAGLDKGTKEQIATIGAMVAAIGPLVAGFGFLILGVKGLLIPLGLLVGHPVIAALGLIAGGLYYAYTESEGFRGAVDGLTSALKPLAEIVLQGFIDALKAIPGVFNLILDSVNKAIDNLNSFRDILASVVSVIPGMQSVGLGLRMWQKESEEAEKRTEGVLNTFKELSNQKEPVKSVFSEMASKSKEAGKEVSKVEKNIKETGSAAGKATPDVSGLLDSTNEKSKKAAEEVKKLREQFKKLKTDELQNIKFDGLKDGITDAIESLSATNFQSALANYEKAFKESTIASLMESYKVSFDEAADLANIQWGKIADDYEDQMIQANENAFRESVSFFESIFQNAITGQAFDLKDALEQVAVGFASQMAATLSGGFSLEGGVKGIGQQLAGVLLDEFKMGAAEYLPGALGEAGKTASGYASATSSSITAIAALAAPVALAAVTAAYGYNVFDAAKGLFDSKGGNDKASGIEAALSSNMMTAWIPTVAKIVGIDLGFGSDGDQMAADRERIRQTLNDFLDLNLDFGDRGRFEGEWASSFQTVAGESQAAFEVAGTALQEFFELTEGIGPQIGFLLAENFGGSIEEMKYALYGLGIDLSKMEEQFVKMGVTGKMSWHEVEIALQGLGELTEAGIGGVGQYTTAFEHLIESGGRGAKAIISVKNLAIEAMEAGATSLKDLETKLRESGKFTEEEIATLFQALSQRGITSLQDLAGASDRELGGIVADIQSISTDFFAAAQDVLEMADNVTKLAENWTQVPETAQTEYRINVKVTGDELPSGVQLNAKGGMIDFSAMKDVQKFAKGGLLNSTTLMGISNGIAQVAGEAGPEYVLPAVRDASGNLGVKASGGQTINISVDARGAMPGVENLVKQAIRDSMDSYNRVPGRY